MEKKEEKLIEDMTKEELIEALKNERKECTNFKNLYQMYSEETKTYKEKIEALKTILKVM